MGLHRAHRDREPIHQPAFRLRRLAEIGAPRHSSSSCGVTSSGPVPPEIVELPRSPRRPPRSLIRQPWSGTPERTPTTGRARVARAGFAVHPRRVVAETVSGSVAAGRRGLARLVGRLEEGDALVVARLDRPGRNAMDAAATVRALSGLGVRVDCLALGGVDLTSSTGKPTMGVIDAVAELERDRPVGRARAGLAWVRAEGKRIGPPLSLTPDRGMEAVHQPPVGESASAAARALGTSRRTLARGRDGAASRSTDDRDRAAPR